MACAMEPICSQRRQSDLWWSFSQMYRCIDAHWQFCPRPKSTAESVWMHCSTLMQAKASQYTWCSAHIDPRITYWFWRTVSQHQFYVVVFSARKRRNNLTAIPESLLVLAYCVATPILHSSFLSGSVGTTSQRSQNHLLFLAYCVPTHIVRSSFFQRGSVGTTSMWCGDPLMLSVSWRAALQTCSSFPVFQLLFSPRRPCLNECG